MAVYTPSYPLTLPTVTGIRTQNWGLRKTVSITQSPFTAQQQVYEHDGQQWKATFTLPPMLKDKAAVWLSFLTQLRGRRGTFKIGDQDRKTIQGTWSSRLQENRNRQCGTSIRVRVAISLMWCHRRWALYKSL